MEPKFEEFITDRRYLKNVSAKTESWYRQTFKHLENPDPTADDLKQFVIKLRAAGLNAVSVNTFGRCVNAYMHWLHVGSDAKCSPACKHPKVPRLKEPERVTAMFKPEDIDRILKFKPKTDYECRTQLLVLMLTDTGCRISELLTLRWSNVDLDNMLVTVNGKGDKQRTIPFSFPLRKVLHRQKRSTGLVFTTVNATAMTPRNAHHSVERFCKRYKIERPARLLHACRHTFATSYLRQGGNALVLQRVLGHSSLEMTRRYAHLQTADLAQQHRSLLSR